MPSYVSILHAYEVPKQGGATEFVSQRSAYGRLDPQTQNEINDLCVLHDYVFSRTKTAPVHDNHAASLPPIAQKLVRTNPRHGRRNYYVGSHARSIIGWGGIESRKLIDELNDLATRPEHRWSQQWSPGDTLFWTTDAFFIEEPDTTLICTDGTCVKVGCEVRDRRWKNELSVRNEAQISVPPL